MDPTGGDAEPSEAERLATARRYRESRTAELRSMVEPHVNGEVQEVGKFSRFPFEALAAIPIFGVFFALYARLRGFRRGGASDALIALSADEMFVFDLRSTDSTGRRPVELADRLPRSSVRIASTSRAFTRDRVELKLEGADDLVLYASSLKTNPWAAGVVRALGGEAPEPLDLQGPVA